MHLCVFTYFFYITLETSVWFSFKGIVHPELEIFWPFTHPQAIRNELVSSLEWFGEI